MARKKILLIAGTRPEAIKLAPVVSALRAGGRSECVLLSTGQHREMLDSVFRLFSLKPDVDLALMRHGQSLEEIASHIFQLLPPVLATHRPDLVIVQGDTSTAFLGALCASYQQIPVAHVEAGLRTYNKLSPFPEELNRRLLSSLADIHFAPTAGNRDNLLREGVSPGSIYITGNTVIDALLQIAKRPHTFDETALEGLADRRILLVTTHRRENFGEPLKQICTALRQLVKAFPDIEIVLPVHPNPNVSTTLRVELGSTDRIRLIAPLDYEPFVHLMQRAAIILTDSGGIQEEAPALGKPVLVMRDSTERPEAVAAGTVRLVGTATARIYEESSHLLNNQSAYQAMSRAINPYGDGTAAKQIAEILTK